MPKKHPMSSSQDTMKTATGEAAEVRRLLSIVEKSQVPLGESAHLYTELKAKIESNKTLSTEEHQQLLRLVKIAKDWEKAVESSARTEPEETLAG